jgi:EF hand domain-containing protein
MSSIQPTEAYANLAATLMKTVDRDGDGKVSLNEFSGFLERLLQQPSPTLPGQANAIASAPAATSPLAAAERAPIDDMAEFGTREKLLDATHQTLKYQVGRVLQFYPHTPDGLRAALPELQDLVPSVTIAPGKGDKLDFGDYVDSKSGHIGVVDVIRAAGEGGKAWMWMPVQ